VASSNASGLVPEDLSGDSLTKYLRSVTNLTGNQGSNAFSSGQNTAASGEETLGNVLNYYTKLMNGSTGDIINNSPETQSVLQQYDAARTSMANLNPRGGMRASQGANLKFSELGQLGNLVQKTRQNAAQGAAQTGEALTNAGLAESGLGEQNLATTLQSLLSRRGQNVETGAQNKKFAADLVSALI